jgi:hypothetical protein
VKACDWLHVIGLYRLIRYAVRKELEAHERRRGDPPGT